MVQNRKNQQISRAVLLTLVVAGASCCNRKEPPGVNPQAESTPSTIAAVPIPSVPLAPSAAPEKVEQPTAPEREEILLRPAPVQWDGPHLAVTRSSAGVYSKPRADKDLKIGYLQSGGRAPVREGDLGSDGCKDGWKEIVGGGFICGNVGTTDASSPKVKFAVKAPDLEEVLPYKYARNVQNGTPLYLSVPSREQMLDYEPYLDKKSKKKPEKQNGDDKRADPKKVKSSDGDAERGEERPAAAARNAMDAGSPKPEAVVDAGKPLPWWQQEDAKLNEVTLESLDESDGVIAKRMVKGFYVAIDRTFNWSGRTWYKTTKGLVAPADRLSQTSGSNFQGVELGADYRLPVGWVYGWTKNRPTYEYDEESKKLKTKGTKDHFAAVNLTGREMTLAKKDYVELDDGSWMRAAHLRVTRPGPPPANLAPGERWIDVNLTTQTVIAFVGTTPYYATLISSGKTHKDKERDHSTPVGEYRIRGKHVTTTMDGDGTAAGDLPYSIEDVPYVMYFYKAYALHGAFWHRNYGVKMSHGCVNLAPLDAKYMFFFADPPIPEGWHGVWASEQRPGSRVVVHE